VTSPREAAALAATRAGAYRRCSQEQALVYGCEDVLAEQLPSRLLSADELDGFVRAVCESEGMDVPIIEDLVGRRGRATTVVATADLEAEVVRFAAGATVATVLHELAHLSADRDDHGVLFRDELVRLLRRHADVGQAAMLHGLFTGVGLEMSPWPASSR